MYKGTVLHCPTNLCQHDLAFPRSHPVIPTRVRCIVVASMLLLSTLAVAGPFENEKSAVDQLNGMSAGEFKTLLNSAKKGNAAAEALLGIAYLKGIRVDKNERVAFEMFSKASKQKQSVAVNNLGLMYFFGIGTAKNYPEAVRCFRAASEQGSAGAQFNLALMYHHGYGVPEDVSEAAKWYEIAARQGDARAQNVLADFYETGTGVVKDLQQAMNWYTKAAESGYAMAQFNLGSLYFETHDYTAATQWFLLAAKQGHRAATRNLIVLYLHGDEAKLNYREAYRWLVSTHSSDPWFTEKLQLCRQHLSTADLNELDTTADVAKNGN